MNKLFQKANQLSFGLYRLTVVLCLIPKLSFSQMEDLSQVWPAMWITPANSLVKEYSVSYFCKHFRLDSVPEQLKVHTSGDQKYQLYVNGIPVTRGPQTGDLRHWYYETTDISSYLSVGENVITAAVMNYGSHPPDARVSVQTAFLLTANDKQYRYLNTGNGWKAKQDLAYTPNLVDKNQVNGYYGGGSRELVDGNKKVWDWNNRYVDVSLWADAQIVERAYARECIWAGRWKLLPRTLPQAEEVNQRFKTTRIAENVAVPANFSISKQPITIPAHTTARIVLDNAVLTTAYPVLKVGKGLNSTIKLTYSEAPYVQDPKLKDKGNRNEVTGKIFTGYFDRYTADGHPDRMYTPFHWRTFRYLVLDIKTAEEELVINDIYSVFSAYPFQSKAAFAANTQHPSINTQDISNIFDIGIRTTRLCSHETFIDCPYYEESQFVGDSRVEALVSYYNFGDSSLGKNAIEQFAWSVNNEGFVSARYPTNSYYYIPNFSIYWIGMLHDYMLHYNDSVFVASHLPVASIIMNYFKNLQRPDGTINKPAYHNFIDWSFNNGEPPFDSNNYAAIVDLHYLMALQWMSKIETYYGQASRASDLLNEAERMKKTIYSLYWNEKKSMFADTPEGIHYSQHTNCLAIITGVINGIKAQEIMQKVLVDTTLTQSSVYWSFYVFEALKLSGLGDEYIQHLEKWKILMSHGLTTWPETGLKSRSECHGWGASPNYHLFKIVAGIEPTSPGFNDIVISPSVDKISSLNIRMPVSGGMLKLEIKKLKNNTLRADAFIPSGKRVKLVWNGKSIILREGQGVYQIN